MFLTEERTAFDYVSKKEPNVTDIRAQSSKPAELQKSKRSHN